MGQARNGVSYEATNTCNACAGSDVSFRSANRPGCGIRQNTAAASSFGRGSWEIARPWVRLDRRLLEMGPRSQGERRVRVGAGQMEARAACRRSLGFAELACQSWWLHVRWRQVALIRD
jgi:hypothetical protein